MEGNVQGNCQKSRILWKDYLPGFLKAGEIFMTFCWDYKITLWDITDCHFYIHLVGFCFFWTVIWLYIYFEWDVLVDLGWRLTRSWFTSHLQPGPRDGTIQCFIKRDKSNLTYHLFLCLSPGKLLSKFSFKYDQPCVCLVYLNLDFIFGLVYRSC